MEEATERLSRAKRRYKKASDTLHKHPKAHAHAKRLLASAALHKIKAMQRNRRKQTLMRASVMGNQDAAAVQQELHMQLGDSVLTRDHSIIGRFNPGESELHYNLRKVKD